MTTLPDLIARLEAAKEGSRELDAKIAVEVEEDLPEPMGEARAHLRACRPDDDCASGHYWLVQRSGVSLRSAKHYTTSLDAALKLVSVGCSVQMNIDMAGDTIVTVSWLVGPHRIYREVNAAGSTGPLALSTSAMKARLANDH